MNYTSAIRKYCHQHTGGIIDVSFVFREYFSLMNYRTFLRIFKRLEKERLLSSVDKGVYFVGELPQEEDLDQAILDYYISDYRGMQIGDKESKSYYTNILLSGRTKHVRNYTFTGAHIFFDRRNKHIVSALELIEHSGPDLSEKEILLAKELLRDYHDDEMWSIMTAINYSYEAIVVLDRLLSELQITHDYVKQFLQTYRKLSKLKPSRAKVPGATL